MKLDITKKLIHTEVNTLDPYETLIMVLESALELIQLPDNNFLWSGWDDADDAIKEITPIINMLKSYSLPERLDIAVLFAPTGPLQELSLSSGWAEAFLKVAEKYDQAEKILWASS